MVTGTNILLWENFAMFKSSCPKLVGMFSGEEGTLSFDNKHRFRNNLVPIIGPLNLYTYRLGIRDVEENPIRAIYAEDRILGIGVFIRMSYQANNLIMANKL